VTITAVRDQNGAHVGFTKVTRDTTERRELLQQQEEAAAALAQANTALQDANQRLQQAADDQAKFLAVTAHELRNPVSVLGGTADTLTKYWDQLEDEERKEMLEGMSSSAVRLRRLLGDLLTASRLQNSALQMDPHPIRVGDLLDRAVATAARTHPGVEVTATAPPELWVDVDADRLVQALDNLVTNAVRHGAPPIRLTAAAGGTDPDTGAELVRLVVSDAGAGVSEAMQERLFERFATGRARGGTGLGLYIVRELARAHGGDATYEPGAGSSPGAFVLTLPRVAAR
jgi:signal transduction histidine kinase